MKCYAGQWNVTYVLAVELILWNKLRFMEGLHHLFKIIFHPVCYLKNIRITIQRTVMLPVVSCASNSVSDIKGRLLRVFKNRSGHWGRYLDLSGGGGGGGVKGDWTKLYNAGLHYCHCTPDMIWVVKSRRQKWVWTLVEKSEGRGPLGRPWNSW
jgi:hypothetical protein